MNLFSYYVFLINHYMRKTLDIDYNNMASHMYKFLCASLFDQFMRNTWNNDYKNMFSNLYEFLDIAFIPSSTSI